MDKLNKDKLDDIFLEQARLDEFIIKTKSIDTTKYTQSEWLQKKSIALIDEIIEVCNAVGYKWWKAPKPLDMQDIKQELVDVLHFFISMCLSAGLSSQELYDIYINKNKENIDRQLGKSDKKGYV